MRKKKLKNCLSRYFFNNSSEYSDCEYALSALIKVVFFIENFSLLTLYIADIENSFFGLATSLGEYKVGVNVRTFNIGDINETTVYFPDGTGQVFTPNFSILGGSIAKKLSENTSVGLNVNYIREGFGRVSASGVAYDLGVQYKGLLGSCLLYTSPSPRALSTSRMPSSA